MNLCKYKKRTQNGMAECGIEIEPESSFMFCDTCRILWAADCLRLALDPSTATTEQIASGKVQQALTQLTGAEFLNLVNNIEKTYLELKKLQFLLAPTKATPRARKSLEEQMEETRISEHSTAREKIVRKNVKAKETKIQRQAKLLGVDESTARKIFEDTEIGDL